MKYIIIDERKNDTFTEEYGSKAEAIAKAEHEWGKMSEFDKKSCKRFLVLESDNPDEEAENHYDGNPVWEAK